LSGASPWLRTCSNANFHPHKYGYLYGSSVELAADPG
jgi:hypothetical protein